MKKFKFLLTIILVFAIFSCEKDEPIEENQPPESEVYPEGTKVDLTSKNNKVDSWNFYGQNLSFDSPVDEKISEGNFIYAGPGQKTPWGYLYRIKEISKDRKTVYCEQASFEDVVENGTLEFNQSLKPPLEKKSGQEGVEFLGSSADFDFNYNFNKTFYSDQNGKGDVIGWGSFGFNSSLQGKIKIENWKLKEFVLKNEINQKADFKINSSISKKDLEKEYDLYRQYLNPIVIGTLAGVPVVFVPTLRVFVGVKGDFSDGSMDILETSTLTTGVSYANGNWKDINEVNVQFNLNKLEKFAYLNYEAYSGASFSFDLYGVAGPYLESKAFLDLEISQNFAWELSGGLKLDVGAKAEVLGKTIADYHADLFKLEKVISEGGASPNNAPEAYFTMDYASGTTSTEFRFDASMSYDKEDGSNLQYRWDWESDGIWDVGYSTQPVQTHKFNSSGTYSVVLEVKDSQGATDEITKSVVVEDEVPEPETITDTRDGQKYNIVKIGNQWWMSENLNYDIGEGSCCYEYNAFNCVVYGRLYTWDAAINSCPAGWHLPSDYEWKLLETYLGMSATEANNQLWRGTNEGGKLKETGTKHWSSSNASVTNETGFTALPGGRGEGFETILFTGLGTSALFWTSTEYEEVGAWERILASEYSEIYRWHPHKNFRHSVRCVKD